MAALNSYELKGKKLSFANWISNLSPTETPFCSMTGKEATDQTVFFWQEDRLSAPADNAIVEGADVLYSAETAPFTKEPVVQHGYTQILRRSFKVSDTANVLANYGRGREVAYQMEKFSLAIKRDLEAILLSEQEGSSGEGTGATQNVRKLTGYQKLVAPKGTKDPDTDAEVFQHTGTSIGDVDYLTKAHIQEMTYQLYLANSEANVIMFHPEHAHIFATFQESEGSMKMFDGDMKTFSHYVNTFIDEFGRSYKLVPNRFMPRDAIYFFNPSDFTQIVLRAPQKTELSKKGNYQHWMIEMEVGLRLRDRFAAGVLKIANP